MEEVNVEGQVNFEECECGSEEFDVITVTDDPEVSYDPKTKVYSFLLDVALECSHCGREVYVQETIFIPASDFEQI